MASRVGSLMKINFILDIARKDERFLNDLVYDPARTLLQSGIDLSHGEVLAVIDIVKDTSLSTLAPHLPDSRESWKAVLSDSKFSEKK